MQYSVIDIETTGLSAYQHRITEIACLKVSDGTLLDEFHTLVNPKTRIPRFITRLTGIDNKMVSSAPCIESVIPEFIRFLGDDLFVAHNATFDFKFLKHNAQLSDLDLNNPCICTCKLARRLLPELPSKRLEFLTRHFNLTNEAAHRARGDAYATMGVFKKFLKILKERDIVLQDDIIRFEKSKISREI